MSATIDVRRARQRFVTELPGIVSRHSLSFGAHYDPANISFGLLLAHNEDVISAGHGFTAHPHRDLEIVTWVLAGELLHSDDQGHTALITPGTAQRVSAGRGIVHAERSSPAGPVHLVQMWVRPQDAGQPPGYAQRDLTAELVRGGLVPVASGRGHDALAIGQRDAVLWAARLAPGERLTLPEAPWVHLFVATGQLDLEQAGALAAGDAVRLSAAGGAAVVAKEPAEILVWEMHR